MSEGKVSLPQLCYDVAYFILPQYAHEAFDRLAGICRGMPGTSGMFFYMMACSGRKAEPDIDAGSQFRWHLGTLGGTTEYFLLEYPTPPTFDMSDESFGEALAGGGMPVLAPYFSVAVRDTATGRADYFVLGQAPMGGGTTLRSVVWTAESKMNCNLGPGPEPRREAFLDAVRERLAPGAPGVIAMTGVRTAPLPKEEQA
jgi:hypothetical protein